MSDIQCIRCQNHRRHIISFAFHHALPIDAAGNIESLYVESEHRRFCILGARGREDLLLLSNTIQLAVTEFRLLR